MTDMTDVERRLNAAEAELAALRASCARSARSRITARVVIVVLGVMLAATARQGLEAQGAGQTVTAPFAVKAPNGKLILEVRASQNQDQHQLLLYNTDEKVAAAMMTLDGNGFIAAGGGGSVGGSVWPKSCAVQMAVRGSSRTALGRTSRESKRSSMGPSRSLGFEMPATT